MVVAVEAGLGQALGHAREGRDLGLDGGRSARAASISAARVSAVPARSCSRAAKPRAAWARAVGEPGLEVGLGHGLGGEGRVVGRGREGAVQLGRALADQPGDGEEQLVALARGGALGLRDEPRLLELAVEVVERPAPAVALVGDEAEEGGVGRGLAVRADALDRAQERRACAGSPPRRSGSGRSRSRGGCRARAGGRSSGSPGRRPGPSCCSARHRGGGPSRPRSARARRASPQAGSGTRRSAAAMVRPSRTAASSVRHEAVRVGGVVEGAQARAAARLGQRVGPQGGRPTPGSPRPTRRRAAGSSAARSPSAKADVELGQEIDALAGRAARPPRASRTELIVRSLAANQRCLGR